MNERSIYEDIALRTGGDIYIGVVGPVRTGKSTFIKRFMETLVIPNIENVYQKERAQDELPQSGSGRTIMTAEPKFVPEEAVQITMDGGAMFSVRLIDCVGYMVEGAVGQFEGDEERMVTTPWFDYDIPMTEAAETGTHKVIAEHSTIGVVITTDGTIGEIGRDDYIAPETRVIDELKAINKPFLILINSADPSSMHAQTLREELSEKYGVTCIAANCMTLTDSDIENIIKSVLYEFPVYELGIFLPPWVDALPMEHSIKHTLLETIRKSLLNLNRIRDVQGAVAEIGACENITFAAVLEMDLGRGVVMTTLEIPRELFYTTLSEQSGFEIQDDGDLISLLTALSTIKREYDRIDSALRDVKENGYGIVMPSREELRLEEPEIVRQGGRYGVKLKASAPSIHMIMANIETEVSPAVGGERSSEDIISFLLQEFEGDASKIWESNMFGKSLYDIAGEGLNAKIKKMPEETQSKLQITLQRIINEGSGGLICIIL
ncbi:MAG: stage IV sporulation protein A, partial [Oscillospiraceae bacterium]|nr:stage IV sporulation protein A [Oscillospiraceae bacterium]